MLLSGALFALFMMGFWLYCLTDAILTPASEFRGIGGAVAWLIVREPLRSPASPLASAPDPDGPGARYFRRERWTDADDAVARHPAGRARTPATTVPTGPDDDPEFLSALDRTIRGNSQAGGEA